MLDASSENESQETPENVPLMLYSRRNCYLNAIKKRVNTNENPLKWYSAHREELKILSTIAGRFLSSSPAVIPSEQLFSSAGLIYKPLRNRLEPYFLLNVMHQFLILLTKYLII